MLMIFFVDRWHFKCVSMCARHHSVRSLSRCVCCLLCFSFGRVYRWLSVLPLRVCVCICGCVYSWPMYAMCTRMTNKRPYVASLCMHQMKWAAFHCHCLIAFFPLLSISLFPSLAPLIRVCVHTLLCRLLFHSFVVRILIFGHWFLLACVYAAPACVRIHVCLHTLIVCLLCVYLYDM